MYTIHSEIGSFIAAHEITVENESTSMHFFFQDKNAIKVQNCKPIQTYRSCSVKLSDQTIYNMSYQNFCKEAAKLCHPVKPKKAPRVELQVSIYYCTIMFNVNQYYLQENILLSKS